MKITACVIPAYNEEKQIAPVVKGVLKQMALVYVVDDGSSDQTAQIARDSGAKVIRQESRAGKGAALRRGMDAAMDDGAERILLMDADGQHDAADIPSFFRASDESPDALIIGNRMEDAWMMPTVRRYTNRFMSAVISRAVNADIPDSQCGFRLVPAQIARVWDLRSEYFEIESEMILKAACRGVPIVSVRVGCCYNQSRSSRISPLLDAWRWFRYMRGEGHLAHR